GHLWLRRPGWGSPLRQATRFAARDRCPGAFSTLPGRLARSLLPAFALLPPLALRPGLAPLGGRRLRLLLGRPGLAGPPRAARRGLLGLPLARPAGPLEGGAADPQGLGQRLHRRPARLPLALLQLGDAERVHPRPLGELLLGQPRR